MVINDEKRVLLDWMICSCLLLYLQFTRFEISRSYSQVVHVEKSARSFTARPRARLNSMTFVLLKPKKECTGDRKGRKAMHL